MTPYIEPALRMFKDAETLYDSGRFGTPDHLYGLACECALKSVLSGYGLIRGLSPSRPFKVHINELWIEYQSQQHGRQMPVLGPNPFANWKVTDRYENDVIFSPGRVEGHRKGAREGMRALELATSQGVVF